MGERTKRGHGEGTIYKRANGQWAAQVTVNDPLAGTVKRKTFYGKTRREVLEKLDTFKAEVKTGSYVEPSKTQFGEWVTRWLELYVKPKVKMSTFSKYVINANTHIIPFLGHILLKQLTTDHIQAFYNQLAKTHSTSVLGIVHQVLSGALKAAVKQKVIIYNPAEHTVRPAVTYKEITPLSVDEVKRYLDVARNDKLYAAFLLDFYTGLRRGELLALRWSDLTLRTKKGVALTMADDIPWERIDMRSGALQVRQSLSRVENYEGTTQLVFSTPKTESGKREIPLLPFVLQALRAHKAVQTQEKLLLGSAYADKGLAFATAAGSPIEPRNLLRKHKEILRVAGLRTELRIHDIRHTFGTLLAQAGENPKNLQVIMGHADIRTTLGTYCHSGIEDKMRAVERLADVIKPGR